MKAVRNKTEQDLGLKCLIYMYQCIIVVRSFKLVKALYPIILIPPSETPGLIKL